MTVSDVARVLAVSKRTVFSLYKSGQLPHMRVGKLVRFNEADVVAYMAKAVGK